MKQSKTGIESKVTTLESILCKINKNIGMKQYNGHNYTYYIIDIFKPHKKC